MTRRVLLVGAGPAHLGLLRLLAREPLGGADVLLLAGATHALHPGAVAGLVAGRRDAAACQVDLASLAGAAGLRWAQGGPTAIDAGARRLQLADGRHVSYDLLSLDPEAASDRDAIPGARELGLFATPLVRFVRLLDPLWALAAQRALDVVVVGAGQRGVELALALQQRLGARSDRPARVALVTGGAEPLARHAPALQARVARELAACRITIFRERCVAVLPGAVVLASGARLACDAPVLTIGAQVPAWLAGSGLALDEAGGVAIGATLQSASHPEVLVAGDDARLLAVNLRRLLAGQPPRAARSKARGPRFIAYGDGRSAVSWGPWSAQGSWVGWWKDRADRA